MVIEQTIAVGDRVRKQERAWFYEIGTVVEGPKDGRLRVLWQECWDIPGTHKPNFKRTRFEFTPNGEPDKMRPAGKQIRTWYAMARLTKV